MLEIQDYIQVIQKEICNKNYDEYVHIFEEYRVYLEKRIDLNPKDIYACCQLAAAYMELRMDNEVSIAILSEALSKFGETLGTEELIHLFTNLAFFYEEDCNWSDAKHCLKKVVSLAPNTPNAYDALGRFLVKNGDISEALPLFESAAKNSNKLKYHYNHAVCLYMNGKRYQAHEIFQRLYFENESNEAIALAYGVSEFVNGNVGAAIEIADRLANLSGHDKTTEFQIADLYFACALYDKHNAMFDHAQYEFHYTADWLDKYFYSLLILGKLDEMNWKYNKVIEDKKEAIQSVRHSEDIDWKDEDRDACLHSISEEMRDIINIYQKITTEGFIPKVELKLDFMYGCYLLDCPRHQDV